MKEFFKTNGKGIIIGLVVGVLVMYIFGQTELLS